MIPRFQQKISHIRIQEKYSHVACLMEAEIDLTGNGQVKKGTVKKPDQNCYTIM